LVSGLVVGGLVVLNDGPEAGNKVEVLGAQVKATPAPTITSAPSNPTASTSAAFKYSDSEKGVTFQCSVDTVAMAPCPSTGMTYTVSAGDHVFTVVAHGVSPSTPTSHRWTVDTTAPSPAPSITGPENPTIDTSARMVFSHGEAGVTFECRLDGGKAGACVSPLDYKKVSAGDHVFSVVAIDAVGNRSQAATWSWTVLINQAFGITGNAVGQLSPGVTRPLALRLSNPYNFSIRVTGITVSATGAVKDSHQDPRCSLPTDVFTSGTTILSTAARFIDIAANSSRDLSSYLAPSAAWPADWPSITMRNTSSNQDDCKNTTFTLSYTGTATKS
jgi:hypothetical protein